MTIPAPRRPVPASTGSADLTEVPIIEDANGYLYSIILDEEGNKGLALEPGGDYDGDIVVPSTLEVDGATLFVTTIRKGAMWKKDGADNIGVITSVKLPHSVWLVGADAFRGNQSLREVSYGPMTRIENRAFFGCPLLELNHKPPIFAYTDPQTETSLLTEVVMPCEQSGGEPEGYHWAFFKQNHSTVDFGDWMNKEDETTFPCYCSDLSKVKGATYRFRNSKLVEDLFRGYLKSSGHYLMLADNDYVATRDFPLFSRWVWGEDEKSMPPAFADGVGKKFGREVASCYEVGKVSRTKDQLAITEFKPKEGQACFALSWVEDGEEVCSYSETTQVEEETGVWNVDDDGGWGIPHILTIAYDEEGNVELFLIHPAPESLTFMHLRQNGQALELVRRESLYVYQQ